MASPETGIAPPTVNADERNQQRVAILERAKSRVAQRVSQVIVGDAPSQGTYFAVPTVSLGATGGWGAGTTGYWAEVHLPATALLTGVAYWVGTSAGSVRSSLYDSGGTRVANCTSGSTVPAAGNFHRVPFDAATSFAPGVYFVCLTPSSNTWGPYYGYPLGQGGSAAGTGGSATPILITPGAPPSGGSVPEMTTY